MGRAATFVSGSGSNDISNAHLSKTMKERDDLLVRVKNLEDELKMSLRASEDIRALKMKLKTLVVQLRTVKEQHLKEMNKIAQLERAKLSYADHVETLLTNFRLVSRSKMRASKREQRTRRRNISLVKQNTRLRKQVEAKDKLIKELMNNSKLLHGQLKLMDERLIYARSQVDNVRINQKQIVDRSVKESQKLRTKFAQITGVGLDEAGQDLVEKFETLRIMEETGRNHGFNAQRGHSSHHHGREGYSPGKIRPRSSPIKRGKSKNSMHSPASHDNNSHAGSPNAEEDRKYVFVPGTPMDDVVGERERERDEAMIAQAAAMSPEQSEKELKKILNKVDWKRGESKQWTEDTVRKLVDEDPHILKVNRPKTSSSSSSRMSSTTGTVNSKSNSGSARIKDDINNNTVRPRTAG